MSGKCWTEEESIAANGKLTKIITGYLYVLDAANEYFEECYGEDLAEANAKITALEAEIAKLNATIDRTVNAWESRCIEKYDEIKRLNIVIDELIEKGFTYNQQQWSELVDRIQKERE